MAIPDLSRPLRLQLNNFTDNMWGGDWIPRLKGLRPPAGPVGESWEFSAHPHHPSRIDESTTLPALLSSSAPAILGDGLARRLAGRPPFLLKFIDSRDDLSVQVHPGDDYARAKENDSGKAESWIILGVDPSEGGGHIYLGFDPNRADGFPDNAAFAEAFLSAIAQANGQGPSEDPAVRAKAERLVLPFLNRVPVRAGDVFDVPPGAVHAIGRGVRLFEIQQSSDVTYRVWDWNRPDSKKLKEGKLAFRELHLERARDVLDFRPKPASTYRRSPVLVERPAERASCVRLTEEAAGRYAAERIILRGDGAWMEMPNGFCVLTVLSGAIEVESGGSRWGRLDAGASILIPAAVNRTIVRCGADAAELVRSYVPG